MQSVVVDTELRKDSVRILVVDDEQVARNLLRTILQESGYGRIDEVENGQDALDALRRQAYHLVLLDKNMPGMDGLQVLEHGKQIQPGCEFIMITAYGSLESVIKAMDLGAHSYITKPFPAVTDVVRKIESAIKKVKIRQENDALLGRLQAVREDLQHVRDVLPTDQPPPAPPGGKQQSADIQSTIERLRSLEQFVEQMKSEDDPDQKD